MMKPINSRVSWIEVVGFLTLAAAAINGANSWKVPCDPTIMENPAFQNGIYQEKYGGLFMGYNIGSRRVSILIL